MLRAPSIKALVSNFPNLDAKKARLIRALFKATNDRDKLKSLVEKVPRTADYVRSLYSNPYSSQIWRVTVALHAIDVLMETFGTEPLGKTREGDYAPEYEYLNMGDPYITTLVYSRDSGNLFISSWGDIAERLPRKGGDY